MTGQPHDHTEADLSPKRQEKVAKQNWDYEGGALHPDETEAAVRLADPVDPDEDVEATLDPPAGDVRAIGANDRDPGEDRGQGFLPQVPSTPSTR